MSEADAPFEVGDIVRADKWDATVPPRYQLGQSMIIACWRSKHCESGWMVMIRSKNGIAHRLDSHWID